MVKSLAHCICGHPIDLMRIHFLYCFHGREHIIFHDAIQDAFVSIVKKLGFMFPMSRHMFCQHFCPCFNLCDDVLTLFYPYMGFTFQLMLSLPIPFEHVQVSKVTIFRGIAMIIVTHAKDKFYHD
jgi:hypothetical protein